MTTTPAVSALSKADIEKKRHDANLKINKLKKLEGIEKNKLYKNQQKLENASSNLKNSKNRYASLERQLAQMEREYALSITEYNTKSLKMKEHIRKVYKHQRKGMFELIFTSRNMNELLDVIYFEKIILKRDYQRVETVRLKAEKLQQMKADIEDKKNVLAGTIRTINSQQKDIKNAIAQNQNMINKLKTDRAAYERSERELARQSANLQTMISKNTTNTAQTNISSGSFLKPIGGRITSPFGWRTHPIFNSRTFHSGVDIGGPNYGNIVASNAGKVIYSGWYGGYGKVVIVDHGTVNGQPTTTLYAHMSTILVNNGQQVSKGQVIGKEGTTGYSTGPHCHFEVRINGKPNNPLNYI